MVDQISALRAQATGVLKESSSSRPVFVEFSGSPKSGKSTCIDIVAHFFRRMGYNVLAPTEGASKRTPYYLKTDWMAFNTWSACYALTHILEGLYDSDKYHLAILDRGLFDALVWLELLASDGKITTDDRDRVHQFLLIDKWRSVTNCVFLFTADPGTSMNRENQDKLVSDFGTAMNPQVLAKLNSAYTATREKYASLFPDFEVIDTSNDKKTTPQSTASVVVGRILNLFPTG
jgi:thymidylate kinase